MTAARAAQGATEGIAAADPRAAAAQVAAEGIATDTAPRAAAAQVLVEAVAGDPSRNTAAAQMLVEVIAQLQSSGVIRVLLPPAMLQFCDADGRPYAGGTLEMLVRGTDTPKDTWTDPEGTSLNSNPIVLDASGRALIYGDGAYRTILRDAAGNLVWDQPSFTYVSSAMAPVVGAATIPDAVELLGINDLIAVEAAARAAADSAEQSARIAADAAEASARNAADNLLDAARIAGDAFLQGEINALVTGGTFEGAGAAWCWTDNASGWMVQGGTGLTGSTATFFKPFPTDILGWPVCTLRDMSVSCTFNVNGYSTAGFICSAYGSSHSDLRGGEHFSYIAAGH